jgi:hypothetical protein
MDLFDGAEEENTRAMRSFRSRESLNKHQPHDLRFSRTGTNGHSSPRPSERLPPASPGLRHRSRSRDPAELSSSDLLAASPLARIYTRRPLSVRDVPEGVPTVGESVEDILGSIRKVEAMMDGIELPVARLRTEMKELQVSHTSGTLGSRRFIFMSVGPTGAH